MVVTKFSPQKHVGGRRGGSRNLQNVCKRFQHVLLRELQKFSSSTTAACIGGGGMAATETMSASLHTKRCLQGSDVPEQEL